MNTPCPELICYIEVLLYNNNLAFLLPYLYYIPFLRFTSIYLRNIYSVEELSILSLNYWSQNTIFAFDDILYAQY